ncbi:Cadherin EGF LAG seven-pass G-type receptor 1 [Holothuria leucospilota]|uniref:Cadherin EGF LAG seven-pass G-type receptor 1 n=1 Tax=Holothuria leucospilota TaxID=206669 RepID=A0A9Q0YEN4_HOLLE|nr:Cadherin EGF LAG seven-pass G-type receptor 1 [Holothuria leucospilota]
MRSRVVCRKALAKTLQAKSPCVSQHEVESNVTIQFEVYATSRPAVDIGGGIFLCDSVQCLQNDTVQVAGDELCKCDDACLFYGDCCYGYHGFRDTRSGLRETDPFPMACVVTYLDVVQDLFYQSQWPTASGYFMVTTCPNEYKNKEIVKECQSDGYDWLSGQPLASWSDYSRHLPVIDTRHNISYKNVYCAWCNNVPIEAMELWTLGADCSSDYPPISCYSIWPAVPEGSRSCIIIDVKSCPNTADKLIADLCHSGYFFPILYNGTTYQNPHCFLCNEPLNSEGFNSTESTFCVDGGIDHWNYPIMMYNIPQFLPFDFYSKASKDINKTTVRCAYGFTLDVSSNECIPIKQDASISFSELCPSPFGSVSVFFYFNEKPSNKFDGIALHTSQHYGLNESSISQTECINDSENVICIQLENYTTPQHIEVFFNNTGALYQSVSSKLAVQKLFLLHSCPGYDIGTMCKDEVVLPLNYDSDVFKFGDMVVIRSREQNRLYYNVTLAASMTVSTVDGRKEIKRILHLCPRPAESLELLCPHFMLDTDEYSLKTNNEEEYIFSDFLANPLSQKYFLITENNISHVCALPGKDLRYLAIIYIVLSACSLFFLALALLTYCIFSFLRNGPGYLTMNFFVALFFSQLILLIGTNQTRNPVVCNVVAITGHYTWLTAFLWTSVIALNVSRTFGTAMVSHRAKYSTKKLSVIMTLAWGIPAIFVGICLFLRSPAVSFVNFSYGSVDGCWIKPGRVNLIIFGLPALGCLLFNLVMFVWTIGGIRRAMKGSRKVQSNKTSGELIKEEIVLYIKRSPAVIARLSRCGSGHVANRDRYPCPDWLRLARRKRAQC